MNKGWDTSVKFNHLLCAIQGLVLFSNCLTFLCNILFFLFFQMTNQYKVGVLYAKNGQGTEEEMYNNRE